MEDTPEHAERAVAETRLVHEMHRRATSLLVEAAHRAATPSPALGQLRDFLVAQLRHHHAAEDAWLWPGIIEAAPELRHRLDVLSAQHCGLDVALDRLAAAPLPSPASASESGEGTATGPGPGADAASEGWSDELRNAAADVRDSVHEHLDHEEPVLFPALRDHVSAEEWEAFAARVVDTTPTAGGHLMIGFLHEIGSPDEVELFTSALPPEVAPMLPVMRDHGAAALAELRGASR
ncbi:hemerythrin domain-containing protein [Streptomyces lonarensis]|uniref:hemerythrin domain-containing protein n=1 Tax=Streptomyces lonarensis TaxID=700599 RepID=UPI0028AE2EE2|nr:hemerythrin domain-containing protein [Streptomyces lonarensis]